MFGKSRQLEFPLEATGRDLRVFDPERSRVRRRIVSDHTLSLLAGLCHEWELAIVVVRGDFCAVDAKLMGALEDLKRSSNLLIALVHDVGEASYPHIAKIKRLATDRRAALVAGLRAVDAVHVPQWSVAAIERIFPEASQQPRRLVMENPHVLPTAESIRFSRRGISVEPLYDERPYTITRAFAPIHKSDVLPDQTGPIATDAKETA